MSGLNVEDVDAIREWWDGEREGDTAGSMLGRLDAVVAEIAGRHVRAALTEAAERIEATVDGCTCETCETYASAARIVRGAFSPDG